MAAWIKQLGCYVQVQSGGICSQLTICHLGKCGIIIFGNMILWLITEFSIR